jgi:hypothetical protein
MGRGTSYERNRPSWKWRCIKKFIMRKVVSFSKIVTGQNFSFQQLMVVSLSTKKCIILVLEAPSHRQIGGSSPAVKSYQVYINLRYLSLKKRGHCYFPHFSWPSIFIHCADSSLQLQMKPTAATFITLMLLLCALRIPNYLPQLRNPDLDNERPKYKNVI